MGNGPYLRIPSERFEGLFARLREAVVEKFGSDLVSLAVYGSAARETVREFSDLDLLVVVENLPSERHARDAVGAEIDQALKPYLKDFARETGWHPYLAFLFRTPEEANRVSRLYFDMTEEAHSSSIGEVSCGGSSTASRVAFATPALVACGWDGDGTGT